MNDVSLSVTVAATVERVFSCLTEPKLLEKWIALEASVDVRVDGTYDFGWRAGGPMKIRKVISNRVLEYVWRYGDEPETVVHWELSDAEGMTHITLVHSGFDKPETKNRYQTGWTRRVRHLEAVATGNQAIPLLRIGFDESIIPQSSDRPNGKEAPVQIGNISLNTDDIEANKRFYVDFLELPVRGEQPKMLALEGNLVIDGAHGNPSTWSAHIMLLADDLEGIARRSELFGYPCGRFPSGNLLLRDPDGRMVEVMPRERAHGIDTWQEQGDPGGPLGFNDDTTS